VFHKIREETTPAEMQAIEWEAPEGCVPKKARIDGPSKDAKK